MNTLVIYDSKFGNTEKIAEAIGRGVGSASDVQVLSTTEAARALDTLGGPPDLLIIGGPTHNRGSSAGLRSFIDALPATLRSVPTACFDTRYRGPALLMGSAASAAAKSLAKTGTELLAAPESFFIVRRGPMPLQTLESGEIERAEQWGRSTAVAAGERRAVGSAATVLR